MKESVQLTLQFAVQFHHNNCFNCYNKGDDDHDHDHDKYDDKHYHKDHHDDYYDNYHHYKL